MTYEDTFIKAADNETEGLNIEEATGESLGWAALAH